MRYEVVIPIRAYSEPNCRDHWSVRWRRQQTQKWLAISALREIECQIAMPATITLTRLGPKTLDDDNLSASLKAVRDAIADAILRDRSQRITDDGRIVHIYGAADGDERITWKYAQEKNQKYKVRITIECNSR